MLEFIDSLPCPSISVAGFFLLYIGSFLFGVITLLKPLRRV
jgi:hypothetical protein